LAAAAAALGVGALVRRKARRGAAWDAERARLEAGGALEMARAGMLKSKFGAYIGQLANELAQDPNLTLAKIRSAYGDIKDRVLEANPNLLDVRADRDAQILFQTMTQILYQKLGTLWGTRPEA